MAIIAPASELRKLRHSVVTYLVYIVEPMSEMGLPLVLVTKHST